MWRGCERGRRHQATQGNSLNPQTIPRWRYSSLCYSCLRFCTSQVRCILIELTTNLWHDLYGSLSRVSHTMYLGNGVVEYNGGLVRPIFTSCRNSTCVQPHKQICCSERQHPPDRMLLAVSPQQTSGAWGKGTIPCHDSVRITSTAARWAFSVL